MIVEDDPVIALDLQCELEQAGFEIVGTAAQACLAETLATDLCPDVVLMDIELANGGDGIELAQRLRRRLATRIIFVSGCTDDRTRERAKDSGGWAFLSKPVATCVLVEEIAAALAFNGHRARDADTFLNARRP